MNDHKKNQMDLMITAVEILKNIENEAETIKEEDVKLPTDLKDRVQFAIEKEKQGQSTRLRKWKVACVAVLCVFVTCTLANVEAIKDKIFSISVIEKKDHMQIKRDEVFDGEAVKEQLNWTSFYYPSYLPEGYVLDVEESTTNGDFGKTLIFKNGKGSILYFVQNLDKGVELGVNNENADKVIEVSIQGEQGMMVKKEGKITIAWIFGEHWFQLMGGEKDKVMRKMAESVVYIK